MVVSSKILNILPEHYGYVILVGVGSTLVIQYLAFRVSLARKRLDIKLPLMYSPDNVEFNCIQRAHQNTLENYPQFLFLMMTAGLGQPRVAAGAGALYQLSRVVFAHGYYTGVPKNRIWGCFGYAGLVALLGNSVCVAAQLLKLCKNCPLSK